MMPADKFIDKCSLCNGKYCEWDTCERLKCLLIWMNENTVLKEHK